MAPRNAATLPDTPTESVAPDEADANPSAADDDEADANPSAADDDEAPAEREGEPARGRWPRLTAAARRHPAWLDGVVATAVAAVALAVYVRSLLPGTGYSGDTAKWQFLGVVGGVPHATGYPVYVALDQAFVGLVPWGTPAWRANLLSAVLAAATVALLYQLLRTLGARRGVAAATALAFAFTTTFWSQAVVAEVYTLHLLMLVALTVCLARWRLGGANAWLLAGLGLCALSAGNHSNTLLILPGVLWLVASDWRRAVSVRNAVALAVFGVLGAGQYLYLLYMNDVGGYVENPIVDLGDVVDYVSGGSFRGNLFTFGPGEIVRDRLILLPVYLRDDLWLLLLPAALGLWRGLWTDDRARRDIAAHLLLLAVVTSVFILNYDVPDLVVFCLPLFLTVAVFAGLGLEGIVAWLAAWRPGRPLAAAVALGLVVIPLVLGLVDYRRASQRGGRQVERRMERALDVAGTHAVILTDNYHEAMYTLYYLLGEGMAESHDLALAREVQPGHVVGYLQGGGGPVRDAVRQAGRDPEGRRPELFTATRHQAEDLVAAGVELTEVAPDVWRVDGLG